MLKQSLKVLILIMLVGIAFGQPPGKGLGKSNYVRGHHVKTVPGPRRFHCINRYGRSFVFVGGHIPPGLRCRELPYGLYKKNMRPHGWEKGHKHGW